MKCPQPSKPEATTARNQNSIGERMEKNISQNWGSVSGAHLGVLDSADVQGCRGRLIWIRTGSSGYGDLGIREKQTNISVDVNLLTM